MNDENDSFRNADRVIDAADEWAGQTRKAGFLYKIYCMGWRQGTLQHLSLLQHLLLSMFLTYRRGYAAGIKWREQDLES